MLRWIHTIGDFTQGNFIAVYGKFLPAFARKKFQWVSSGIFITTEKNLLGRNFRASR
jgi:hypothetical protein